MRKFFTFIVFTIVCCNFCFANYSCDNQGNKVVLVIKPLRPNPGDYEYERSIDDYFVDAYYYSDAQEVECELFNLGVATVYIVDTNGLVVNQQTAITNTPTDIVLSTSTCQGPFYIVIESDKVYAEGYVSR